MEDLHFQRRGAAAAALPGRVAAGGRAKPAACYDDVFGGPPRASLAPARPEDYREIFGAAATCSIPVLDLPPPPGDGYELRQCSALDYLDIFGGLGGGDFAASYQELFASKGSNEVGAPPLPSELGGAAPVAGASNSRGLKGMGSEEQEMPASGVIIEGPSGDQVRCLSNGVAYCLNDDYTSNHVASWSSKNDSVHGTIHKNQVHAVPGFAFVVKSTEFDNPHTQVDVDIYFDAHCGKVTSEQQHLRKTMLSTTSFSDVKYSVNDMKGDQRSTRLESSGSLSASACEENPSCSSKNQSTVPSSNGFSAKASNNQILHGNCMEKKTEGIGRNETVLTSTTTASSGNDLKVKSTAVDFSANEGHLSHSSNGHSASAGIKSSPDHLTDAVGIDTVNTSTAEANHFTKSMSGSPSFTTSSQSSEDRMAEQKKSNSMYNLSKDATVNEGVHSFPSSTHSISSLDQSGPDGTFVTVSDINLRTQPFQGPPPARPPPARPSGRNLRRTWTEHQKHDMRTEVGYKSHSFKHPVRDGSPPPFDVEVDASSAAAASLAAIKEAMELAQARLKSAKISMERKKDNLQSRRKLGLNEDPRSINRYEDETVQQNQKIREEVLIQLACEKTDGQTNVSTAEKMVTTFSPSLLTGDFKGKERDHGSAEESLQAMHWQEPGLSNLSNKKEDKVGEWKVAEQFYEFIQSEKNLKKVPENSLKEDNEKRPNARIGIAGEEPIASELKTSGKLLAASKVMEWEGDKATNEKKTKDSQVAALESYMAGDCNRRQKETVNAHHQEKRPGEFQELQETEQETKWRTSKEAFICELSEKNLRVNNDASKCKSVHGCQGQEKIQRSSGESSGCEETEKEIKVTEKYLRSQGEEKDNLVWSKLSQLDDNKIEAKVTCVSHVSAKNIHLQTVGKNHECENLKMQTNGYDCFPKGQNIKAKEARLFFGQDKGWLSKLALRAFEWAENEDEVEAPMEVHDWKGNDENFNVVQGTDGCSGEAKRLKEIQKFPIESDEFQLKVVEQQNTSCTAGIKDNFEDNVTVAQEYCKRKITENVKEVQVVDSNMGMKSARDVCKAPQESSGNQVADWPVENGSRGHEMEDVNGDKLESEQTRYVEEKEREIRKLEEKERENVKFEERDKKRIELEEEKEREKNLEVAKKRERGKLKEEKERERKIEEEKVRERVRLEEERERERIRLEEERERERRKLEEERERQKLEEKREKIRLEEERESERQELEEERERIRLEEERERKKLEEERERQKLEQERERIRLEEERERERKKLEEERERQKLEEERERMRLEEEREREKKKLEGEERERKKIEDERREKKRLEEERERKKFEEAEERRKLEEEERRKLEEEERERMRKKQEEEDRERCKLEEKERERRKQEEDRERRRLEEIERERRKLEEKVRERRRIEEEERERKLEEEKARERQKIEEDKLTEKRLDEEREKEWRKREEEKEWERKRIEEEREREKEREKDRQAVERATREAHERAFAEARERAERAAVERITAEARQRALAEARERAEKTSVEALEKSLAEKASREARLRSERAAVERATAEARERAVEKAIAGKAAQDARERAEKLTTTTREGVKQNANIHASFANEKFGGSEGESAIRCKARMERHQRTVERAAKALAEKNLRDIIAQREQVERNRFAETLDADVKRWSNGKEGNLRALLSTLQYILGPESGWQPIPLTDVVTAPAVKKAYRKATLYVHPDKLQQRGASIQQKYICEKVFDLLKEAWNKFNSEER